MTRAQPEPEPYPIDLGGGWRAALEMTSESEGLVYLRDDANDQNWGAIPVNTSPGVGKHPIYGTPTWHLVSQDPLTLRPSIDLKGVVHDFITDGRWQAGGAPG